jgi:hypothetical protein
MIGLGRLYSVTFVAVSVTAQQDLMYLKPAADKICVLERVIISANGGAADAGDAQEELYDIEVIRVPATVTAGSGGGAFTPLAKSVNDAAAGATARINDTTKATTSGALQVVHADGMNSRVAFDYFPPPEHRDIIANAQALVVRLNTTPADAILLNGTLLFREMP